MEKTIEVHQCYHRCPFFGIDTHVMVCGHPFFDDAHPSASMIITHDNSKNGRVPERCPLREGKLTINYVLELEKYKPLEGYSGQGQLDCEPIIAPAVPLDLDLSKMEKYAKGLARIARGIFGMGK
jgi:hypothetical protein